MDSRRLAGLALSVAAAVVLSGLTGCGTPAGPADPHAGRVVSVSTSACGTGWTSPRAGEQTLYIRNTDPNPATVDLLQLDTGAVFAEADNVGPNTTRELPIDIGGGRFAFRCAEEGVDNPMITGPQFDIPGPPAGPGVVPVAAADLIDPDKQYVAYVTAGLVPLVTDVDALQKAVHGGNTAAAQHDWLTAHLDYERLGAAYDAFGDFDDSVDGRADGKPAGTADPDFTGFHRVEQLLWQNGTIDRAALGAATDKLDSDVHALQQQFPHMDVAVIDLGLRTHEILENALQFELTGTDDYGSGTTLATIDANIDGTQELLTVLDPVLQPRYHDLAAVHRWMDRLRTQLRDRQHNGGWTPVSALAPADRRRLDGTLGELTELLAPIATICTPRKTFQ